MNHYGNHEVFGTYVRTSCKKESRLIYVFGGSHNGANPPIYNNSQGYILWRYKDGDWRAGVQIADIGWTKSVDTTAECPENVREWNDTGGLLGDELILKCND